MSSQNQKIDAVSSLLKEILDSTQLEADLSNAQFINFKNNVKGKGLIWSGEGATKQFIYSPQDKFFMSEDLDIAKGKSISINNIKVIDDKEIGSTVLKSNLRQVGRLKGLVVEGSVVIDDFINYDSNNRRFSIGTDQPNAIFSIVDNGAEIVLGSRDFNRAGIGTYNSSEVEIITDNTARITIGANGNIELGNQNFGPVKVSVIGTLSVNISNADPRAALHVNGAIKFNDKLHLSSHDQPQAGYYVEGDIVWNNEPRAGSYIGWVCTRAGSPGVWNPFGEIK
jgi:hypothetical protein